MNIKIRSERAGDGPAIYRLVEAAFKNVPESDRREHYLVERLHKSASFIPELSIVAEADGCGIVGYILLTEVKIISDNKTVASLGVAPLAVSPRFQNRGIGGALLLEAHKAAASLGYGTAVLLGHKDYYPRFGYRRAADFGIEFPFDAPEECCMAAELLPGALKGVKGVVNYPEAFYE